MATTRGLSLGQARPELPPDLEHFVSPLNSGRTKERQSYANARKHRPRRAKHAGPSHTRQLLWFLRRRVLLGAGLARLVLLLLLAHVLPTPADPGSEDTLDALDGTRPVSYTHLTLPTKRIV